MDRSSANAVDPVVIVIAHGSRAEAANDAHRVICSELGERLGRPVTAGFLELATPDIPTALDDAVRSGAVRIVVVPYFIHPGNHTSRDIPALVESARSRHPEAEITIAALFGADPAVLDVLTAQVRRATADSHLR